MDDSILIKYIVFKGLISFSVICFAFIFFSGKITFDGKSLEQSKSLPKVITTKIILIIIVLLSIWYASNPTRDYIFKDYEYTKGILKSVSNTKSGTEFNIEGDEDTYYLPEGLLNKKEKGELYKFKYGKRSKVIIEIEKIE